MKGLRKFFGNSDKNKYNIYVIFMLGIVLLIVSNVNVGSKKELEQPKMITSSIDKINADYTYYIESKLENILSMVKGAGDVKVMITLANEGEITLAKDLDFTGKETIEKDNSNGIREIKEEKSKTQTLFSPNERNINSPIIIKEVKPKIEGVVILVQGGDNIQIVESFIVVAESLLDVPVHKIQILNMK